MVNSIIQQNITDDASKKDIVRFAWEIVAADDVFNQVNWYGIPKADKPPKLGLVGLRITRIIKCKTN